MNHTFRVLSEQPVVHVICNACGYITSPSYPDSGGCSGKFWSADNNRTEPDPEILRALGHNLK